MPLGYLSRKFKNFLGIFKRETYVGQPPPGMTMERLQRLANKVYLERNKELEAQNLRMKAKLEEINKEKLREKKEEKIADEIIKFNEMKKLSKYKKTLGLRFYVYGKGKWRPLDKLPTFFLKSDKPLHKIAGAFMEQTDDGYLQWVPWLQYKGKDTSFKKAAPSFKSFFQKNIGIVSQIMGGKVDSNFDIDRYGQPVFKPPNEYVDYKSPEQKIKVINISEQESKRLEDTISIQKDQISQLVGELERTQRIIDKYDSKSLEDGIKRSASEEKAESYASSLITLSEEIPQLARTVGDAMGTASSTRIRQSIAERNTLMLMGALEEKEGMLRDMLPKEERDIVKQQIKTDLDDLVLLQNKLTKGGVTKDDVEKIIRILRGGAGATGEAPKR